MHIEMDTIVYVSTCSNSIINDDAPVPPPVAPSRPKKASAVLLCLHNNLQVYLIYYVYNFAFVFVIILDKTLNTHYILLFMSGTIDEFT